VTETDLRGLITDSLLLWGVWGRCVGTADGLLVSTLFGQRVLVRRASEAERPAFWIMRVLDGKGGAACRDRPAGSIVGLLGALRKVLGAAKGGGRVLRIVPSSCPASPLEPGETQARLGAPASSDNPASSPEEFAEATRVSVVTGFLGSGKTTLIQKVLRDPRFARTAVIVNEFGEIGFDHDVLASSSSDAVIRLSTGCLCCAVRNDLIETLLDLHRRRADGELDFERIIIETSGLADPVPILQSLMMDKGVAALFILNGVLTLVDAVHGPATVTTCVEARRQVAMADRILLTKTDLADPSAALLDELRRLNPDAPHAFAEHGAATLDWLFEPSSFRDGRCTAKTSMSDSAPRHTGTHQSIVLTSASPIPALALTLLLQALADHAGDRLLRMKGLVLVVEMPDCPALVHGVQHVFAAPEWLEAWPGPEQHTRIVLIGTSIPRRWPARLLEAIREDVSDAQRLAFADTRNRAIAPLP